MSTAWPLGTKCCVRNCGNVFSDLSAVEFHHFPTDLQTKKTWCEAVKLDYKRITKRHAICDAHFPEYMYTLTVAKELNEWAVPRLDTTDRQQTIEIEIIEQPLDLEIECIIPDGFTCDICCKPFATRDERNAHIDDHFKTHECGTCGETLYGDRQFEHHRISNKCVPKRKIEDTTYECYLCHKEAFFSLRSLKIHFNRLHKTKRKNSKGNICEYCSKSFSNIYIMKQHIQEIHMQDQRSTCKDCGKVFNRASNLYWHQLIHQNELPYPCKVCGKAFRTLSGVNLHKRTHTGEKPYKCDICNEKAYAYNTDLKRHKRSAHGIIDKVFNCSKCNEVFYEPKFLRKHMQKVHD